MQRNRTSLAEIVDVLHMAVKPHTHECDIFLQYMTLHVQCALVGGHHGHKRGRTSRLADAIAPVRLCGAHEGRKGSPGPQLHSWHTMRTHAVQSHRSAPALVHGRDSGRRCSGAMLATTVDTAAVGFAICEARE